MNPVKSQRTTAYMILELNGLFAVMSLLWNGIGSMWPNLLPNFAWLNVADGYSLVYLLLFAISFLLGDGTISPIHLLSDVLSALQLPNKLRQNRLLNAVFTFLGAVLWWIPAVAYPLMGESQLGITALFCYIVVWILFFRALHVAQTKTSVVIDTIEAQKAQQAHIYAILIFAGMICGIAVMMLLLRAVYILFAPEYKVAELREPHLLAIAGAVGFVFVLFLGVLYHRYTKRMRVALEKLQLQHQVEQNELYIDLLMQKYHTLQRYQHDFKKHLVHIQQLAQQDQSEIIVDYIATVYDDLQTGTLQKLTGNQTLDVLLSEKLQNAQNHNVQMQIDYHPHVQLHHITAPDLCILLGNLLDNAITASATSEAKQIICQFRMKNEYYTAIHITNSCDIAPIMANGIPQTQQDDEQHGYGVQNVIHCARKYGGDCRFDYDVEKQQFRASVLLNTAKQ